MSPPGDTQHAPDGDVTQVSARPAKPSGKNGVRRILRALRNNPAAMVGIVASAFSIARGQDAHDRIDRGGVEQAAIARTAVLSHEQLEQSHLELIRYLAEKSAADNGIHAALFERLDAIDARMDERGRRKTRTAVPPPPAPPAPTLPPVQGVADPTAILPDTLRAFDAGPPINKEQSP